MRKLILIVTAIAAFTASAAQAEVVRCRTSPTGWCNVTPAQGPMMHRHRSTRVEVGFNFNTAPRRTAYPPAPVVYNQGGAYREEYREVGVTSAYTASQLSDPRGAPPVYEGARREGGCTDPNAVFINKEVGCSIRVSDPQVMEKYRGRISDICGDFRGDKVVPLPDGGRAHYMCP